MFSKFIKYVCYILVSVYVFLFSYLIISGDVSWNDISGERITLLKERSPKLTHDIILDMSTIGAEGGMAVYAQKVAKYIIDNRPDYRFIVLHKDQLMKNMLAEYENNRNVIFVNSRSWIGYFFRPFYYFTHLASLKWLRRSVDKGIAACSPGFNDTFYRLKQVILYGKVFADKYCNLIFSLATPAYYSDLGLPQVSVLHDIVQIDAPNLYSMSTRLYHTKSYENNLNTSTKIISISNFTKECVKNHFKGPDVDDKIVTVRTQFGARLKYVPEDVVNETLDKFKIEKDRYFVFPSSFWSHKNHKKLVEAFSDFVKSYDIHPNFKLVLMGRLLNSRKHVTTYAAKVIKFTESTGIKERIVFTDYVTDQEFTAVINNALAVVNPSLYEGFGLPIAEAMFAGKPVVCSNVASLPEIGGDAALYFNPEDIADISKKLALVYFDSNYRNQMINKGYIQVQNFTNEEKMLADILNVIESVMYNVSENPYKRGWEMYSVSKKKETDKK